MVPVLCSIALVTNIIGSGTVWVNGFFFIVMVIDPAEA